MSTISEPVKNLIITLKQTVISVGQFNVWNQQIENKLAAAPPIAKAPHLQPAVDAITKVYREAMQQHQMNLRLQFDIGQKFIQQIDRVQQVEDIGPVLAEFQTTHLLALEEHKKLEAKTKTCEEFFLRLLPLHRKFIRLPC